MTTIILLSAFIITPAQEVSIYINYIEIKYGMPKSLALRQLTSAGLVIEQDKEKKEYQRETFHVRGKSSDQLFEITGMLIFENDKLRWASNHLISTNESAIKFINNLLSG
jgi:hypothetical protein